MRCCLTLSYLLEMHSLILEQAACHCIAIGPPLHVQYFRKTLSVTLMTLCLRLHPGVYMWCPRGTALVVLDTVNEQYFGHSHRCDLNLFVHL